MLLSRSERRTSFKSFMDVRMVWETCSGRSGSWLQRKGNPDASRQTAVSVDEEEGSCGAHIGYEGEEVRQGADR